MGMGGSDGCRNDTFAYSDGIKVYIYTRIYIYNGASEYDISDFTYRFQGYGTTISKTISSPSVSNNNLDFLIYGCM